MMSSLVDLQAGQQVEATVLSSKSLGTVYEIVSVITDDGETFDSIMSFGHRTEGSRVMISLVNPSDPSKGARLSP